MNIYYDLMEIFLYERFLLVNITNIIKDSDCNLSQSTDCALKAKTESKKNF